VLASRFVFTFGSVFGVLSSVEADLFRSAFLV